MGKSERCTLILLATVLLSCRAAAEMPAAPALADLDGRPFAASDFDDRLLLINFWATWCLPCRIEMPDLDELQQHYDPGQLTVLGIAADEPEAVATYLEAVPVGYPVYIGDPDEVFAWSERLGNYVVGLPFSALLDASGTIRWIKAGGRISVEEARSMVDELLLTQGGNQHDE